MSNSEDNREAHAQIVRETIANADLDSLEAFMRQYALAAGAEWLIAAMTPDARTKFLRAILKRYLGGADEQTS